MSIDISENSPIRLYALPALWAALDAEIAERDGEIDGDLEARLDALEARLEDRVEALAALIRQHEVTAGALRDEVTRLRHRQQIHENAAAGLKAYLLRCLQALGRRKVDTGRFPVTVVPNSRPLIRWVGRPDQVPEAFQKVTVTVDGETAYQVWRRDGQLPEGFQVSRGEHLRIG